MLILLSALPKSDVMLERTSTTLHHLPEVCNKLAYVLHQVALELGSYIGYSAIRTARKLPAGSKLYGIDPNETHVRIARAMIEHAGLSDKVEIIQGILETSIPVSAAFNSLDNRRSSASAVPA